MSPLVIAALGLLALAALVGWSWWRKWHRELAAARHTYHAAQQDVEAATVFYGSMQLDPSLEWHHAPGQDWREATMAELSPEALDPGLGGDASSPTLPPPGPDQDVDGGPTVSDPEGAKGVNAPPVHHARLLAEAQSFLSPASLAPVWERLADTGDITAAHTTHPHPDWLDGQLVELYAWVKQQLAAA